MEEDFDSLTLPIILSEYLYIISNCNLKEASSYICYISLIMVYKPGKATIVLYPHFREICPIHLRGVAFQHVSFLKARMNNNITVFEDEKHTRQIIFYKPSVFFI